MERKERGGVCAVRQTGGICSGCVGVGVCECVREGVVRTGKRIGRKKKKREKKVQVGCTDGVGIDLGACVF